MLLPIFHSAAAALAKN